MINIKNAKIISDEWAILTETELEQLVEYMKNINENKKSGLIQNEEGILIANEFTWLKTTHELMKALEILN